MATNENQTGVSRRDLLKKGAVAGGIVWTAPIVLSARDIAGAQATSALVCSDYYIFKFNVEDDGTLGECDGGAGNSCVNRSDPNNTYSDGCDVITSVTAEPNEVNGTYEVTFTYSGDGTVQQVLGYAKVANETCVEISPTSGSGNGPYTFEFDQQYDTDESDDGTFLQDTSHVEISLCIVGS